MYEIMIFIKGTVNGRKVTDYLYRDNVMGYVIRNKYDTLTKSEHAVIEFHINLDEINYYTETFDIVGEFTVKIKEMKMTKDDFIKAYLNASEQIREIVENILTYTIDGKPATKEEIEKYIKEVYEKGETHADMRGEYKNG